MIYIFQGIEQTFEEIAFEYEESKCEMLFQYKLETIEVLIVFSQ